MVVNILKKVINPERYEISEIFGVSDELNSKTDEGKQMREIVFNWLKEQKIDYDKIIFSPEDKLKTCLDNNVDIMIEENGF